MMKRFGIRVLAAAIASSLIVTPVMAAPTVDDLKKNKEAAQGEVNSLQAELKDIVEKIDTLERNLAKTGEEIDAVTVDLKEAEELEKQQYEDMKLRIKYMYEQGDMSAFEAIVNAKDFSDLMNKAEYVQKVHSYDRKKLNEYVETKEKVKKLKTKLENEQKELQSLGTEYEAKEEDLNVMIEEKSGEVEDLDAQLQQAIEEVARKAAEEAARKEAEEKARREAEEKAAQQNDNQTTKPNADNNTTTNNNNTDNDTNDTDNKDDKADEPGYSAPVGGSVVDRAYSKLGCPYKYGATGPNTFDCSGFVSFCLTGRYGRIGTSGTFAGWPKVSNPQPGDVCVKPGHVGIYIGNGKMIHAPHTGDVVKISSVHKGMWYVRR